MKKLLMIMLLLWVGSLSVGCGEEEESAAPAPPLHPAFILFYADN